MCYLGLSCAHPVWGDASASGWVGGFLVLFCIFFPPSVSQVFVLSATAVYYCVFYIAPHISSHDSD